MQPAPGEVKPSKNIWSAGDAQHAGGEANCFWQIFGFGWTNYIHLGSSNSCLCLSDSSAVTFSVGDSLPFLSGLPAMAVSKAHCELIDKVGEYADQQWKEHGSFIAGQKGYDAMRYQGVKMSHPDFPIFCNSLAACLP